MTLLPAIILLAILLIGLQALLAGFRGRRIDDHPLCRGCGFDLTGRPETSTACSECGADLSKPQAIVIGHRRRRPRLIALGALVMAFAVVSIGSMALRVDFQVYKPTWWVIHEAADKSPGAPIAAWTELNRRLKAGELSQSQVDRVAALALSIQGDKRRTWNAMYGDFIDVARKANQLSDADWQKYARQAPNMSLEMRAKVRRGDFIPASILESGHRIGSNSRLVLRVTNERATGDLIHDPPRRGSSGSNTSQMSVSGSSRTSHRMPIDKRAVTTAPTGPREAALEFDVEVREGFDDNDAVVARWKGHLTGTWALVEAGAETVELINDPSLAEHVRKAITVLRLYYYSPGSVSLDLQIKDLKVPCAFDVSLRADGKEHKLADINLNTGNTSYGTGGQVKITAKKVDVIFRASTQAARNTTHMTRIWNGGFEVKDVTLEPPATQQGVTR